MSSIEKAADRLSKQSGGDKKPENQSAQEQESPSGEAPSSDSSLRAPTHSMDMQALQDLGFLTPDTKREKIAEEYRSLKRPILMNAFGKGATLVDKGNIIMVVSALPGEGKTFTSLNLAISMAAERDKTVLLIDSDVVKPSLTKIIGLQGRPGLIDILLDTRINLADVIVTTDIPNLSLLPSGQTHVHSTELLASDEMEKVVDELAHRYSDRIVLFDAPPILATTESQILTQLAGQILMVVEAGRTPQSAIKEAVSRLDPDKVVGMVLNKNRRSFTSSYYGGGYGYYNQ